MKRSTFLISCLTMLAMNVFAQQTIKASNAISHIGELVTVADTVYKVKAYNDSTAIIDLGGKNLKAPLNVVLNFTSAIKSEPRFFKNLKAKRIAVTGFVVLVENQPAIVLTDRGKLRLLSTGINKKWLMLSFNLLRDELLQK
jgi:hypothetical protein